MPNYTQGKNKSEGKYNEKPMYPKSMQSSSGLDSLSIDLEGFKILAVLIYSSVIILPFSDMNRHSCQREVNLSTQQSLMQDFHESSPTYILW